MLNMKNKFVNDVVVPQIEERKQVLDHFRSLPFHDHIDREDIHKHSIEYDKMKKKRLEERMKERFEKIKNFKYSIKQHKTKTFENMNMREEMKKTMEEEKNPRKS
jgi:hypothetical protein